MNKYLGNVIACLIFALLVCGCAQHDKKVAGEKAVQMPLVIDIARDGSVTVAKQPCPRDQLSACLAKLPDSRVRPVVVQADEHVTYQRVTEVLEACKTAGFQKVSLKTAK